MCIPKNKILTTEEWKLRHTEHLAADQQFSTEPFEHPHEDWKWLICPCGARHLSSIQNKI